MARSRSTVCLCVLALFAVGAFAQDAAVEDCGPLKQVKASLEAEVDSLTKRLDEFKVAYDGWHAAALKAQEEVESLKGQIATLQSQATADADAKAQQGQQVTQLEAQVKVKEAAFTEVQSKLKKVETQLTQAESRAAAAEAAQVALQGKVQKLQAELATAQQAAAQASSSAGASDLLALAESSWLPLWAQRKLNATVEESNLILKEFQDGKFDRLRKHSLSAWACTCRHAAQASEWALAQLEKHAPGSRAKIVAHVEQAQALLKKHVTEAEWAQVALAKFFEVEAELQALLTKALKSHPATAPYADPVYVQAAVYVMVLCPVFAILVSLLCLVGGSCCGCKQSGAGQGASKKNKKKAKAAAAKAGKQ